MFAEAETWVAEVTRKALRKPILISFQFNTNLEQNSDDRQPEEEGSGPGRWGLRPGLLEMGSIQHQMTHLGEAAERGGSCGGKGAGRKTDSNMSSSPLICSKFKRFDGNAVQRFAFSPVRQAKATEGSKEASLQRVLSPRDWNIDYGIRPWHIP